MVLFIPVHITQKADLYAVRLQLRQFRALRERLPALQLIITLDKDPTGYFNEKVLPAVLSTENCEFIDMRESFARGIVAPTRKVIETVPDNVLLMRLTQDSYFTSIDALVKHIEDIGDSDIVGGRDVCSDIRHYLKQIGVSMPEERYAFVQGNFILACAAIWRKHYLRIPPSVQHYCDDSIFSYLAEKDGCTLRFVNPAFWCHNRTRNVYDMEAIYA